MLQFCACSGSPTATTSLSCKTSSGILMPLVKDSQQLSLAYECVESIRGSVNGAVRKGGEVRKERPGSRVPWARSPDTVPGCQAPAVVCKSAYVIAAPSSFTDNRDLCWSCIELLTLLLCAEPLRLGILDAERR